MLIDVASRSDASITHAHLSDTVDLERLFDSETECIQFSAGTFTADVLAAKFGAVHVTTHDCSRGVKLRRHVPPDQLTICYSTKADRVWDRGRPWDTGDLLAVSDGEIDASTLSAAQLTWIDVELERFPELRGKRSLLIYGRNAAATQLRGYVGSLLQMCAADPLRFNSEEMCGRVEKDVAARIERAFEAVEPGDTVPKRERKAFSLVRRVEQFMWQNVDEPLTLERIGQHVNCRMRSLIHSFKDSFGVGPIAYLKILRLNEAHRRLRESRGNVRIFDVAVALGFWHMGHFSSDYKRMFGMTASETLADARADSSRSFADASREISQRPAAVH